MAAIKKEGMHMAKKTLGTVPVNADRLLQLMGERGFTDESLAKVAGCAASTVENYRKGRGSKSWPASPKILAKIAKALSVEVSFLVADECLSARDAIDVVLFGKQHLANCHAHCFVGAYAIEISAPRMQGPVSFNLGQKNGLVHSRFQLGRRIVVVSAQAMEHSLAGTFEFVSANKPSCLGIFMATLRGRKIEGSLITKHNGRLYTYEFIGRKSGTAK
jgi:transcriptional regulator with XRE-family HTH domain